MKLQVITNGFDKKFDDEIVIQTIYSEVRWSRHRLCILQRRRAEYHGMGLIDWDSFLYTTEFNVVAYAAAIIAVLISTFHIFSHLRNYSMPQIQGLNA